MKLNSDNPKQAAAEKFLAALQKSDPIAYQIVMQSVNKPNSMAAMGGIWDDIKTGLGNLAGQGIQYYTDKEAAKQAQKLAEEQAKIALIEQEAVLQRLQVEQQNAQIVAQIERERLDLMKIAKDIEFSNVQKIGLTVAAGLVGLLVFMRLRRA